ncbi:hypothetical protein GCM10010112_15650 [Actinoplanes lobatus]|uniref:Uncharacterized protein n=2 Tax=Actinoplanes lobatus TaxID=113568 RepID=A0A7W7MK54_9ACTN|nr:hypothetical protein [Actinoplanes lobatus]MBB4753392.1 hypothetical protein [Actinoplanes lobatus]GGN59957.1 hypothetical protein GCM10010112_15650 [Actinoplanes lobatus]GIE37927.1 hypothetical protein Alo02nite_08250 [Actinoplanes lobatus]
MLSKSDFDLPVPAGFTERVRRGVRRRRRLRVFAVVGCVLLGLAGISVAAWPEPRRAPVESPAPAVGEVAGFRIGYAPPGLRLDPQVSSSVHTVTENLLVNDGSEPGPGQASAVVTMRVFVKANGGNSLFITVLQPLGTTPRADRAAITRWLSAWSTIGMEQVGEFAVPTGTARLMRGQTTDGPKHQVLITTADGTVIDVGGNAELSAAELTSVATGLSRG